MYDLIIKTIIGLVSVGLYQARGSVERLPSIQKHLWEGGQKFRKRLEVGEARLILLKQVDLGGPDFGKKNTVLYYFPQLNYYKITQCNKLGLRLGLNQAETVRQELSRFKHK